MSRRFSACVAKNKCAGLTHSLISHLWHTHMPRGMAPLVLSQATRWARRVRLVSGSDVLPYPDPAMPPVHSQHPPGPRLFTYDQKSFLGFT